MQPPSISSVLLSAITFKTFASAATTTTTNTIARSSTIAATSTLQASRSSFGHTAAKATRSYSSFSSSQHRPLFNPNNRIFLNNNNNNAKPFTPSSRLLSSQKTVASPRKRLFQAASSIPLLGSLFSSSSTNNNKTDMGSSGSSGASAGGGGGGKYEVQKSESEWQAILSPEQFKTLRQQGTERPYTGKYDKHMPDEGVYNCAACNAPLYTAQHKFKSGCGWPAYFDSIPGAVERHTDSTWGMTRTEIVCAKCGGHLGHVFKGEGYNNPTDERHCVNSISLNFSPEGIDADGKK